ncbi:restriction endonuclease subunit S [Streptococcus sp. HSISS3]|jgi:restriction modification system DNA specificity domain protein|uniref:restriction endonuclease subunit S n=1 Tax=Streptococcus sp. HSISS3 TaxID=1316412 RepID=UPI00038B73DC|nr:Type I restriction-modificationsystem, specificity subunit S [Streptococcus sp. HSISS3]
MTNSKYVPKRRFKEFVGDGEWEQNQLKELAEFSKGRGYSKSELQTDGQPIILYGRLYTKYETVISTVDTFTHIKENSVLSKGGEVLVPSSGESAEDIARASVVAEEGIIIGGDLNIIKLCKKIEPIFLSLAISNGKQKEEISKRAQGKSVVHVNNDDLKQVNVLFPSISEQIQIGKFFQTIDALISNHQHKLDKLKNLKKAYLTEMFPAEGERVPKRRFPGFEGEWEWKKLGELATIVRGASPRPIQDPKWFDSESEVGWLRISDVTEQNGRIYKLSQRLSSLGQEKTRVVSEPHLILSIAATVGKPVINYVRTGIHDGFLIFQEPKFEIEYMYYLLGMFRKNWAAYGQPGSQLNLNSDIVKEQRVAIPSQSEQVEISKFFKKLDQSITLQQQKLDKLNDLKKAYLNELFV